MKRSLLLSLFILCCWSSSSLADTTFVFDVKPLSLLSSSDVDGFKVTRTSNGYSETIDGNSSWFPTANVGMGLSEESYNLNFTVGGGYLYNSAFDGGLLHATFSAALKKKIFSFGPHLGLIHFGEMKWDSENNGIITNSDPGVTFDSTNGIKGGVDFTVGHKIHFIASMDYIAVDDSELTKVNSGWTTNRTAIDLSGWAISLGVAGTF